MLQVIVGLEQSVTSVKLYQDAADAPDVAGIGPAEAEDDLGRPIVTGRHDARVVLVLEGGRTKVDEADLRVEQDFSLGCLAVNSLRRRRHLAVVRKCLILVVAEKDVLGLEIGVDQVEVVKDCARSACIPDPPACRMVPRTSNAGEQLAGKILNLAVGEGHKVVALEEVEDALAKQVHDDAYVAAVVEAIAQVDAPVAVLLVVDLERGEHPEFDLAGIAVLLDRPNDLDGDKLVAMSVLGLDNLAKCALAQQLDHFI